MPKGEIPWQKKLILICLGMSLLLEVKPQDWFQMEFLSPFFALQVNFMSLKTIKCFINYGFYKATFPIEFMILKSHPNI